MTRFRLSACVVASLASLGACGVDGEIGPGPGTSSVAEQEEIAPARLVATAKHPGGNEFDFYQSGDGSMTVIQRGRMGSPPVDMPEDQLDTPALFKLISPGVAVPEALLQADRSLQRARQDGLVPLPGSPGRQEARESGREPAPEQAVEQQQQALSYNGMEDLVDHEEFRQQFCKGYTNDRCYLRARGPWKWSAGKEPGHRRLTTAMVHRTGSVDVQYATCWYRIGCRSRINGPVEKGTWWSWKVPFVNNMDYSVHPAGGLFHFADSL